MQCGVESKLYKKTEKQKNLLLLLINSGIVLLVGALLARVQFTFVEGFIISPFGIAYLISIINKKDIRNNMGALMGVSLGYLSIIGFEKEVFIYIFSALSIFGYGYLIISDNKKVDLNKIFIVMSSVFFVSSLVLNEDLSIINISYSGIKLVSIIATFYIINYGVKCISEINTNYIFSTEELISMALIICLLVAGIGDFGVFGLTIRNVVGLIMVIAIAYVGGPNIGSLLGITMGFIIGISNNDLIFSISLFSMCGLITGIFKETGKILSIVAYIVSYFIIISYSKGIVLSNVIEMTLVTLCIALMPINIIKKILLEINGDEKIQVLDGIQLDGIKEEFLGRLDRLKAVLVTVSSSLNNLSENDKLLIKGKATAMVDSLADRVCLSCEFNAKCWKREFNNTFMAFSELIETCEQNSIVVPKEIQRKCVNQDKLVRNAENIINTQSLNEAVKERLVESRKLVASQIGNMSLVVNDIIREFESQTESCFEVDKTLRKALSKNKIRYKKIYTYTDKNGRLKIKIYVSNEDGVRYCVKDILPVMKETINLPLIVLEDETNIDIVTNDHIILIEESPKYNVKSYVSYAPKDGEVESGDSFNFGKNRDGLYVSAISDGMGSGPNAKIESSVAIDLVERFLECGFDKSTTLNTVNSIIGMKFTEEEKFTTLDMNMIDLYSGEASFLKFGGVISFIKRSNNINVIQSCGLPFGVLDFVDVKESKFQLKPGDIVISLSDGIVDVDKREVGNFNWVYNYLETSTNNPEDLSKNILNEAKRRSDNNISDDMTVIVSKVYSVY